MDHHSPQSGLQSLDPITYPVFNNAESYFIAWQRSGDRRYFERAKLDAEEDDFFQKLSEGKNALPNRHAYGHTNALSGAAKSYLVLGDEKYLRAAVNGLKFLEQQSFATGGYGSPERFLPRAAIDYTDPDTGEKVQVPGVETPGESILREHQHFETGCGSYAHLKLTRYLLRLTQNAHYGDSMERVIYNAALGMLPLNKFGKAFYQSNYHRYARKAYFDGYGHVMEDEWPCCSGTFPQLAADYGISSYFRDGEGVYVNLYIPSTLRWSHAGADFSLQQTGSYPLSDSMTLRLEASGPRRFSMRLRIPAWSIQPAIYVNGKRVDRQIEPGTFATVARTWRSGDKIEVVLPKRLELKAADEQHPNLVALVSGPMVLFAIGHDLPKFDRDKPLAARQTAPASAEWRSGEVRFLPWWIIREEVYTTYHEVS